MNARTITLLVVALVLAGAVAFLARNFLGGGQGPVTQQAEAPPPRTDVLVAATNLPIGRIIQTEDLKWQSWPDINVDPNYIVQQGAGDAAQASAIQEYRGHVVRAGIRAGEPITLNRIVGPSDRSFLAAALKPGMRASTIGISRVSSIGGNIHPGDRVDVLLVQNVVDDEGVNHSVAETVFQNVRILAIDARLNPQGAGAVTAGDQQRGRRRRASRPRTATLEVTPKMAEEVAMLGRLGSFTLVMRPLPRREGEEGMAMEVDAEDPTSRVSSMSWGSDVSSLRDPYNVDKQRVIVSRGDQAGRIEVIDIKEDEQ